jgi:hypothetical protein
MGRYLSYSTRTLPVKDFGQRSGTDEEAVTVDEVVFPLRLKYR